MQRADIRYPIIAVRHIAVMVVVNCAFAALFDRFVTTWIWHYTSPTLSMQGYSHLALPSRSGLSHTSFLVRLPVDRRGTSARQVLVKLVLDYFYLAATILPIQCVIILHRQIFYQALLVWSLFILSMCALTIRFFR